MISPSTAPAHGFDDYLKQLLVQSRGGVDFGNFALLRDSKPCWMGRISGMSQAEQISGWADGEQETYEASLRHTPETSKTQPGDICRTTWEPSGLVRIIQIEPPNVIYSESALVEFIEDHPCGYKQGELGRYQTKELHKVSRPGQPQIGPSLPRPSGPFPWASDEDCEFFSATQAGELPQ